MLLWQIDVSQTVDLVLSSEPGYLAVALAIYVATTWLLSWRWQILLGSKGIHEPLGWLTRLYFVGYAAGQVRLTSLGGDALRIIEHARRRPNARGEGGGAVPHGARARGGGTLVLVAVGLVIAAGRYSDIAFFVWMEVIAAVFVVMGLILVFSRRSRMLLESRIFPFGRRIRIERPLRSVYSALHGYRDQPAAVAAVLAITVAVQFTRVMCIWLCGEAVGVELTPLVYIVLGPLLFLVMLIPFTINGLGAREAFFVAFLSRFDVGADEAFAIGFLFYAVRSPPPSRAASSCSGRASDRLRFAPRRNEALGWAERRATCRGVRLERGRADGTHPRVDAVPPGPCLPRTAESSSGRPPARRRAAWSQSRRLGERARRHSPPRQPAAPAEALAAGCAKRRLNRPDATVAGQSREHDGRGSGCCDSRERGPSAAREIGLCS